MTSRIKIILLLILLPFAVFSQCKFKQTIDTFENDTLFHLDELVGSVGLGNTMTISIESSKGQNFVSLTMLMFSNTNVFISKNSVLSFKLDNDSIISVSAISDFTGQVKRSGSYLYSFTQPRYFLPLDVLKILSIHKINMIRANMFESNFTVEIRSNRQENIQEAFRCLLDKFN